MDEFHSPKPHKAPVKSLVSSVLKAAGAVGSSAVSIVSGLLAGALILYSGYVLYDTFEVQEQAFSSTWEVQQYKPEIIEDGLSPLAGQNQLAAINEDYRSWITMYETNIDYPVMQSENDLYYASHDVYGDVSLTGAIYLAAGNTGDLSDSYNLIYGHHMDNGAMFGALDEYLSESYINSHKEGVLVSPTRVYDLEVFAVVETDAYESAVYSAGPDRTVEEILSFLNAPGENTTVHYLDAAAAQGAEKITALSTCASAETNGRLVVFCVTTLRNLIELQIPSYEGVYDALPHSVEAIASYPDGTTIEYSYDGGVTWSEDLPTITDVGTIHVLARAVNDDYGRATAEATLTVTPKAVTVTAIDSSKVYGTEDPAFTGSVEGVIDDQEIVFDVTRPGAGSDEDVDTYPNALIASGEEEQGNYVVTFLTGDFTIEPAPMDLVAIGYSGVYDGQTHFGDAIPSVKEGTTLEYRVTNGDPAQQDGDDEGWTTTAPSITNIGTYDFEVRAVNRNYITAYDRATLTVNPCPVTVRADPASKVYGDEDPGFTAAVTGTIGSDTVEYSLSRPGVGTDEEVGTYRDAIVAAGEEKQGNYVVSFYPADFTITSADTLTITPIHYEGQYDANAHPARVSVNIPGGTTIEYSLDGESWSTTAPTITDVGTLRVYARAVNPNYETAETVISLTVTPCPVTVTARSATKVFGTADPAFTATVTGVIDGYQIVYTVTRPRAGTDENAGTYPQAIVAAGAANQGNYSVTYVPGTFTITPAAMSLTAEGYTGVYDAEEHSPTATPSITNGTTIEYSIDGGETWTTEVPTIRDVDTIEVLIRATNPNYDPVTTEVTLEVSPRAAIVTALDASKNQGEADPTFEAVVDGVIDDFVIVYTVRRTNSDEAVGTYEGVIVPSGEAVQGNYTVTYIPATFTILGGTVPGTVPGTTPTPTPEPTDSPTPTPTAPPEEEEIIDEHVPLVNFFRPKGGQSPAWALVNLLCVICTAYLLIPLLHLRDKYGRSRLMKRVNEEKLKLREAMGLKEKEEQEKQLINMTALEIRQKQNEKRKDEEKIASDAAITEEEFSDAVDELYYRIKKFLRRFRIGVGSEVLTTIAAIVAFILTEDMRTPMILIDKWTPLMILILAVTWIVDIRLARYREKVLAEEAEKHEDQAAEAVEEMATE